MKYIYPLWQKSDFSASPVHFLLFFFIRVFPIHKLDHSHLLKCLEIGAAGARLFKGRAEKKRDLLLSGLYLTLPPDSLVFRGRCTLAVIYGEG